MGILNQTSFNIVIRNCQKLGKSLLCEKPLGKINIEGLKYLPQRLTTDVVEITQTQKSGRTSVRRALVEYFSESGHKAKAEAAEIIDKYIQKLANKNYTGQDGISFDDFLQNYRLKFWEIVSRKKQNGTFDPKKIMIEIAESRSYPKPTPQVGLTFTDDIEKYAEQFESLDFATEWFEREDLLEHLVETPVKGFRSDRIKAFLKEHLIEGKSLDEIADKYDLTIERVGQILKPAREALRKAYNTSLSDEFLADTSKRSQQALRDIITREEVHGLRFKPWSPHILD